MQFDRVDLTNLKKIFPVRILYTVKNTRSGNFPMKIL